jgi:hypothetical protein
LINVISFFVRFFYLIGFICADKDGLLWGEAVGGKGVLDGGKVSKVPFGNIDLWLALGKGGKAIDCEELLLFRIGCLLFNCGRSRWHRKASGEYVIKRVFSTDFEGNFTNLWKIGLFESCEKVLHRIEVIKRWSLSLHFDFLLNFLRFLYCGEQILHSTEIVELGLNGLFCFGNGLAEVYSRE